MENINKLNHCRICLSPDFEIIFTKSNYEIARCKKCNFVFLNFDPNNNFLKDYYSKDFYNDSGSKHGFNNYEAEVNNLKKTFRNHIKTIKEYKSNGNLLDIGCATGIFLEEASKNWRCFGVEISKYACQKAREKNLNVFNGNFEQYHPINQKFEVITAWDTIEHLPDPQKSLKMISKILKNNGILVLTTGDVCSLFSKLSGKYWHLYNVPQHLSYFDKKSITYLLNNSGLEIREIIHPSVNFSIYYCIFRLITLYRIKPLFFILKTLSKINLLNQSIKINLGDIMMVIAQKRRLY